MLSVHGSLRPCVKNTFLRISWLKSKQPCSQLLWVFQSLASEFIDRDMIKFQAAPQRLVTIIIITIVIVT